jgi:hypothetical protein
MYTCLYFTKRILNHERIKVWKHIHCKHRNLTFTTTILIYISKTSLCALWNNLHKLASMSYKLGGTKAHAISRQGTTAVTQTKLCVLAVLYHCLKFYNKTTPWTRAIFVKLIVTQLVKNFPTFVEPEVSFSSIFSDQSLS